MPIVPLFGHEETRRHFRRLFERGTLPASLLIEGRAGIGKQRLALWLAQLLVCERDDRPCGSCQACRLVLDLRHPDVYWIYPRPNLKDATATTEDVLEDFGEANQERLEHHGLYAPPSGSEGIFLYTIRTIVQRAALAPALSRRKVFVVGDADRMVAQEGSDQAANAFLKLLEEPPADTTIILTSSEPGALLPTIQSRVVATRARALADADVHAFVRDANVKAELDARDLPRGDAERVRIADGAPGDLLSLETRTTAREAARRLLRAASSRGADRYATALAQGAANARGAFSDTLAALTTVLRDRAESALRDGDTATAYTASRAVNAVCEAQARADGNVSPQLITAELMRALEGIPA
jgi:DNA polymerase-3 subunit delta'